MKRLISGLLAIVFLITATMVSASAFIKGSSTIDEGEQSEDQLATTSADNTDIVSISAGYNMSSAVRADGSVWTWGSSDNSLTGLAEGTFNKAPRMIISKDTKSSECSQFFNYEINYSSRPSYYYINTALLKDDNSLWMFGGNEHGALGDGNTNGGIVKQPFKVLDNVVDYDVAGYRSAAVTADGKLFMWGYNRFGQIGNGTTDTVYMPTEVLSDVVSVSLGGGGESYSTGNGHSAAIKSDGSLWMWGCNKYGQLGNGTTTDSLVPIKIMDNVKQVSLGESFTVILKNDGSVWTCGNNGAGQLAKGSIQTYQHDKETHYSYGTTYIDNMWPTNVPNNDKVPKRIIDLEDETIVSVDAGYNNAAAVSTDGNLYMWGDNRGQSWGNTDVSKLGNGSTSIQAEPIIVLRDVKMVSVGYSHSIALKNDNTLWSWGTNYYGELGDCTNTGSSYPKEFALGGIKADFYVNDIGKKTLDLKWDDGDLSPSAGFYNKQLAIDGIVLSEAAYSDRNVIGQFGFKEVGNGMSNDSIDKPGYLIGYKLMYDYDEPRLEILISVRGTKSLVSADALTDAKSVGDGFDGPTKYLYDRLKEARSTIASKLGELGLSSSKKNTKYYLVGHSLGGACAGKLALKIGNDGIGNPKNIHAYTFAAPNYTNMESKLDTVVDIPGVFNLVHDKDFVPTVPTRMFYFWPLSHSLYKAGLTFKMSTNDNPSGFEAVIKSLYNGEVPWDTYMTYKSHMTSTYLALIMAGKQTEGIEYTTEGFRTINILCPVDVEVYDSENDLCATTMGEKVSYPKPSSVRITVIDDEKFVELPDESFTIKYIGTDLGRMKIEDQIRNVVTNEVEHEKVFNDVILEEGKLFASNIEGDDDTSHTDLTVIDDEGDSTYLVDDKGKETKIAKYEINPDDVHINAMNQKYDGTEKTVEVTVENLTEGKDYRVIYNNNTDVGTASVSVKGINLYEGRVTETFGIYDSGSCGDEVQWTLSSDGLLSITGSGDMTNYTDNSEEAPPWNMHGKSIKEVEITEGITSIGDNAFKGCSELSVVDIPSSVVSIGNGAFEGCDKVQQVYYEGDNASWNLITIAENNNIMNTVSIEYLGEKHLLGDTDRDGSILIVDATYIQRHLVSIPIPFKFSEKLSDADEDGIISIMDATYIQRWLAHLSANDNIGKLMD